MISIVNANNIAAVNDATLYGSLALIALLSLVALLISRELSTGIEGEASAFFRRILYVGMLPLTIGFAMIVIIGVGELMH